MFGFHFSRVDGISMSPVIPDGSYVLINTWRIKQKLTPNRIVKVQHSRYGEIIKRIEHIDNLGKIWLKGEHPNSVSTAEIGPITKGDIIGIVNLTVKPNSA